MTEYRLKTEEEFRADNLWDKVRNTPYNWEFGGSMNKYLGQDIPLKYNDIIDRDNGFYMDGWSFAPDNIIIKIRELEIKNVKRVVENGLLI